MFCNPIQLSIPLPCREDWQQMSPSGEGRFCASCQKTVIDFSGWTDTALYEFFRTNTGPVCGRFQNTQLNRDIKIPPQPKSRLYRLAIACGLTLIFAQVPEAHSKVKTSAEMNSPEHFENDADSLNGRIEGLITDTSGNALIGVIIQIFQRGIKKAGTITDSSGHYYIDNLMPGHYELNAEYISMERFKMQNIEVSDEVIVVNIEMSMPGIKIIETPYMIMGLIETHKSGWIFPIQKR